MHDGSPVDLSTDRLDLRWGDGATLGLRGAPDWLAAGQPSPLFAVVAGEQKVTAASPAAALEHMEQTSEPGVVTTHAHYISADAALEVVHHIAVYEGTALFETWQSVRNTGAAELTIRRLDSLALALAPDAYELVSFTGDWGREFESIVEPLEDVQLLETRRGRSSKDRHPWFALLRTDGAVLSASIAWSGNWIARFDRDTSGAVQLSAGLHDWEFEYRLAPGATLDSPRVAVALGNDRDLNSVSIQYARAGRTHWYPHNRLADQIPVEWNHWWSYEDHSINEDVFRANVDVAAGLGIEVCTLDAGWFGPTDPDSHWYDYRGDWHLVNAVRFPSGLRDLSEYVHQRGMRFGLWCEIEALGQHAALAAQHPEFVATREGERLGYVCFGNSAVRQWALATLERLIENYRLDWIKLDFNLDPGAGCNRTDHGHGLGDGLLAHYEGYYATLEQLRARYPEVVLENCSSGGLRIDLGMARRTGPTFLSDPDWPEHGLQLIWGASTMLAPSAWLHWGWSEWVNQHPKQTFNPRDPALKPHQLDYYLRIGSLGVFGLSQKLPELPPWIAQQYKQHIELYRGTLRRFVREADFYRLTEQPRRYGLGDRWAAFQYVLGDEHLVAVFRLPGGQAERTLRLYQIDPAREYTVQWLGTKHSENRSGAELLAGLRCSQLPEEGSELILIRGRESGVRGQNEPNEVNAR